MAAASTGLTRNSVGKHPAVTLERLEKALSKLYFSEHNLSGITMRRLPADAVRIEMDTRRIPHDPASPRPIPARLGWTVPTSEQGAAEWSAETAAPLAASKTGTGEWTPISVGHSFGPSWSTHAVRVRLSAGAGMATAATERLVAEHASDAVVFVWNSDCEAAAWVNGTTMCGLTGGDGGEVPENSDRRAEVVLAPAASGSLPRAGLAAWAAELQGCPTTARPGQDTTEGGFVRGMVVEVACNGMFGVGGGTMIGPPDPCRTFSLKEAHCAVVDGLGWRLYHAFLAAVDMAKACAAGSASQRRALFSGNAALNAFDRRHRPSWERALEALQPLFEAPLVTGLGPLASPRRGGYEPMWKRSGPLRRRAAPRVHALGHCHIDTAWLWPIAESARKARRSWASVVDLLAGRQAPLPAPGQAAQLRPASEGGAEEAHGADVGPGCAWGQHPGAAPLVFAVSQPAQMAMLTEGEPWWDGLASSSSSGGGGSSSDAAAAGAAAVPGAEGADATGAAASMCGDGALWGRVKAAVAAGGVVPVGGMWVEPDANLLGGESWVRQLVEARRWYARNLITESSAGAYLPGAGHSPSDVGRACAWEPAAGGAAGRCPARFSHGVAWLPDTFGMQCAQLPALLRGAGMDAFLTQKLSWSLVHKHPHTTFHWRALSGQRVLAHFPPSDSYNTKARAADLVDSRDKNKDAGRCDATALLFGHGDGGGGPTAAMLASLSVLDGAEGMPDVVTRGTSPAAFFEDAAFDAAASRAGLSTWDGEIHLELHQGTYTSIPAIKRAHQDAEAALLVVAEAAAALELALGGATAAASTSTGPAAGLARLVPSVRRLLTAQFHDILPGTSIALAHRVAVEWLRQGQAEATGAAVASVARALLASGRASPSAAERWLFNASATHASGLLPAACSGGPPLQFSLPPLSLRCVGAGPSDGPMGEADVVCSVELAAPTRAAAPARGPVSTAPPALPLLRFARGDDALSFEIDAAAATARVSAASDAWAAAAAVTAGQPFHSLVRCTDQPWFWDAWDVMVDRSERAELLLGPEAGRYEATHWDGELALPAGEPVPESLPPAVAAGAGGQWARVDTRHRLPPPPEGSPAPAGSDPDAWPPSRYVRPAESEGCLTVRFEGVSGPDPLLRVTTALPLGQGMHWRGRRDSLRAVFRFAGLPTSCVATFDTAFGAATRPATARSAREDMLHETCMHRWVALSAPMSAGGGVGGGGALVIARAKHGVEARGNCVALTLDRRVEAPDAGPHATGECAYAVAFFSGPLDPLWARQTAAAVAGPPPLLVGPADLEAAAGGAGLAPKDPSGPFASDPIGPLCSVAPASSRERCCPLLETVKLPRLAVDIADHPPAGAAPAVRSIVVRVREACGVAGTAVLTTPPATAMRLLDLLERPLTPPAMAPAGRAVAPAGLPSVAEPLGAPQTAARPWWELSDQEWAVARPDDAEPPPARFTSSPGVERVGPGSGPATQWRLPIGALAVVTAEVLLA